LNGALAVGAKAQNGQFWISWVWARRSAAIVVSGKLTVCLLAAHRACGRGCPMGSSR
jgi:hypothetical protein